MSSASSRPSSNPLHLEQSVQPFDVQPERGLQADTTPQSPRAAVPAPETVNEGGRQQPISPPSEPMQYRAIGLIRGRYVPDTDQFNRGQMRTADGTILDAVLLGQIMSLVKKHLDLASDHLWVVYPRTREKQAGLHVQIVGVWEPEALQPSLEDHQADLSESPTEGLSSPQPDGYFSVRGEVMFQSQDQGYIVVRIQQSPRRALEEAKSFKLRLEGTLPGRAVGYFWDLEAQRQGDQLIMQQGTSIAMVPPKKPSQNSKKPLRGGKRYEVGRRPAPVRPAASQQSERPPISKPIKRNHPRPAGS